MTETPSGAAPALRRRLDAQRSAPAIEVPGHRRSS